MDLRDAGGGTALLRVVQMLALNEVTDRHQIQQCHDIIKVLTAAGADPNSADRDGKTPTVVAMASDSKHLRSWGLTVGCYLGRYYMVHRRPVYRSATCHVYQCKDRLRNEEPVAVKVVTNAAHLEAEITSRFADGELLDSRYVMGFLRLHVPTEQQDEWKSKFNDMQRAWDRT